MNRTNRSATSIATPAWSHAVYRHKESPKRPTRPPRIVSVPKQEEPRPCRTPRLLGFHLLFLLLLTLSALAVASLGLARYFIDTYLVRQLLLHRWSDERAVAEHTAGDPERTCSADVISTNRLADLKVHDNDSAREIRERFQQHGVVLFDKVLSEATARELRAFILEENKRNLDTVSVFNSENRWSFQIQIDHHPSVRAAIGEILSHEQLVAAIESIVGDNPAVTELTTITVQKGAVEQLYHTDSGPSGEIYGRSFTSAYSLFIPLQNTTADMGSTGVCPGTRGCSEPFLSDCRTQGLDLAANETDGLWKVGSAALLSQQTMHRGGEYTRDDGELRAMFYFTFSPRPRWGPYEVETRTFPIGGTAGLHWSQWGFTLRDYQTDTWQLRWPFRMLRAYGIYKPASADWGWDFLTHVVYCMGMQECGYSDTQFIRDQERNRTAEKHRHIPAFLLGTIPTEVDEANRGLVAMNLYVDILNRCRKMALELYLCCLAAYLLIARGARQHSWLSIYRHALVIHVLVLWLCYHWYQQTSQSSWAHNIETRRLYQPITTPLFPLGDGLRQEAARNDKPMRSPFLQMERGLHQEAAHNVRPKPQDVLDLAHLHSEYLGSLSDGLDWFHPGNRAFYEQIQQYASLSSSLQALVDPCLLILEQLKEKRGRILATRLGGTGSEMEAAEARRFCELQLVKAGDSVRRLALDTVADLRAETRFGYWRDSALHQQVIPRLLRQLEDRIMAFDASTMPTPRTKPSYPPMCLQQRQFPWRK